MNGKNNLCMSEMKHIYMTGLGILCLASGVSAQSYDLIERRNSWNAGVNVTGILTDTLSASYAELYGRNNHGDFHRYSEAKEAWSAGAVAKSITHLKGYSLTGSFSFDHTSGKEMSGSMFIHPGSYPVDLLEFTPGRKALQTYTFMGGMATDIAPHWRLGGKIDFAASNYSKRKDLRHTNYRLDLKVVPAVMYHSGELAIGLSYLLGKNSESVKAEVIGTAENSYNAFLDKGLMYGAYEAWDGSGIHLSESGVNGFPIKELSNGGALQLQWKGFYGDVEYTYSSGSAGEREAIWFTFPTHRITSHLRYRFKQGKKEHFLRLDLQWSHLTNHENVLTRETVNGITTTHVHGSNPVFEQSVFSVHPEYEFIGPRTELRLGTNLSAYRRLVTQMYPYVVSEKMLCSRTTVSGIFHLGKLDLKAAASFAIGNVTEKSRTTATDTEPGEPPYRLTDVHRLKNEYATAPQATCHLGLRYRLDNGMYAEVQGSYTYGFNLRHIEGSNRWNESIKLGYTF